MGLLSFLKRSESGETARPAKAGRAADAIDDVQQLRIRARRRLIGAAVLVVAAVIVFPLLFETRPRPIPIDLPIEIPRKDAAAPLNIPAPPARTAQAGQTSGDAAPTDGERGRGIINETAEQIASDREVPPPSTRNATATAPSTAVAPSTATPPPTASADKPAEHRAEPKPDARVKMAEPAKPAKPETRAEARPETRPDGRQEARTDARPNESARVQAMLDGRAAEQRAAAERKPAEPAAASGGRFIVQVGAYADAKAAQEARMKVERMGLKTYTQAVDTADGKRIRVRVGPFGSRDEADKVAAKVRGGGLSSAVLTI